MSIPRTSTRRPVAVAMLFLAVILLGGISYVRLPVDLLPDVSYPRLVVYTSYPDVAPREVERLVSEPVEAQAAAVPGVEKVSSVSREGVSLVTLRFAWGTDMNFAMLNVRERMDNIREDLPESATRPRILRVDPESEPIMAVSVAGGADLWETKELAETVFRRRMEQLDGVAQAAVTGGLDREIQVEVDAEVLESYGLALEDVSQALDRANYSAPGGTILRGRYRYPLRTLGEFQTVEEIRDVVVGRQFLGGSSGQESQEAGGGGGREGGEGAFRLVRLDDVARVVDGFAERESIARYDGHESVGILVFKESGANTVSVAEDVERVLGQLRTEHPSMSLDVASSQAGFISESISNVVQALVLGGVLAFLVLFFFLRDPRYPVAIATAIPISVVGTFALMEAAGVSLNIMSLGGLALGVGMLVDNSIVVLENVFRHREEGSEGENAAAVGAEEVQGAITASTLTTISVFGPIIYVEGVAGELFGDLSLAVAFSLLASLLVALTLLPALAARFRTPSVGDREIEEAGEGPAPEKPEAGRLRRIGRGLLWLAKVPFRLLAGGWNLFRELLAFWWDGLQAFGGRAFGPLLDAFDRGFEVFARRYHQALEWSLDHRTRVLGMAGASLAAALLLGMALERDLLPDVDQGAFQVRVEMPEGTRLEATAEAADALEAALLADEGVETVFSRIGKDVQSFAETEAASGVNTAVFEVRVARGSATDRVVERLRPLEDRFPQAVLTFETGQATALGRILGGSEADVAVRIRGQDLDQAYNFAETVLARLSDLPSLGNLRLGTERGSPEYAVEILPEVAARYGIEPRVIAETLDRAMRGERATEFVDFDRKIGVVVRLPEDQRHSLEALENLRIQGVPVRELVRVRETVGPAEIRREDQGRVVTAYADVVQGGLAGSIEAIEARLGGLRVPADLRIEVGGENEEMRRSFRDLAFAFGLALLLVYMILAAQFESFVHPFTILMAVPLAVVGAVLALGLTGQGLNTMSLIGVVILVGIVVNDAIVKVDFINQARDQGMDLRNAILEAGRVRLRPILMTTVTTVLGLTPMALGIGRGADLRAPLAIAVIGGLIVATLLTLIVVPVVYDTVERVWARILGTATSGRDVGPSPAPGAAVIALVTLPLLGGLAGCGGGESTLPETTVRDSAGIVIVESPDPGSGGAPVWRTEPDPLVQIGTLEGPEEYQLFQVRGAHRFEDGRIAVADGGSRQIRFYGADGTFLRSAAGEGSGPGELQGINWFGAGARDTLFVFDFQATRVSVFGPQGEFARSFRMGPGEDVREGFPAPQGLFSDGTLFVSFSVPFFGGQAEKGVVSNPNTFLRVDREGEMLDTLGVFEGGERWVESGEGFISVRPLPFGRSAHWTAAGNGFWHGAQKAYRIGRYDREGSLERLIRVDREPPPVTEREIERYQEDFLADRDPEDLPQARRRVGAIEYPERMPTFASLETDASGNLWVEDYTPPGGDGSRWTVFDPEGRLLAKAELPDGFTVHEIGTDWVLGGVRDEFDVQYVRLYRLVKEGGE